MVEHADTGNVHDLTFVPLSSPVDPRQLLADRVEVWGDLLLPCMAREHDPLTRQACTDVLSGLSSAVVALRGQRPDSPDHLGRAVRLLARIDLAAPAFMPGPAAEGAQKL